ncbi:unnamed protein product (macronuclear) [Paramecium tetraurelia]|uniref:Uncharacterized protein n=1 Tax=Paramecium tetraurelia TaxID=5888 RepID=A0CE68_PARTE|nr:uncharacterized protein GSPATT00037521001 [Paramecium tetraurelia]CAK69085.1 unnamed protein product [Paramecium tetraurelia]|eukprot:XP_001436482.1 hypothetical protein (macronuclear) [Paramecium tetraurelia strain d4-2]
MERNATKIISRILFKIVGNCVFETYIHFKKIANTSFSKRSNSDKTFG